MERGGPGDNWRVVLGKAVSLGASLVALASAFWGLHVGIPKLDAARAYWSALPQPLRDDPVADLYGFGEDIWTNLDRAVGSGDRYAVLAEGERQHEIRNYASYRLLPAILVRAPRDADVVVYYEVEPPAGANCEPMGTGVCVIRRNP